MLVVKKQYPVYQMAKTSEFTAVIRTDVESTMLNNLCPKNLCNKTFRFMNVTMHQIAYSQIETLSKEYPKH